jgi:hypothetical protein
MYTKIDHVYELFIVQLRMHGACLKEMGGKIKGYSHQK